MSEQRSSLSFERIADRYDATRGGEQRGRRTAASLAPLLDPVWPVVEIGIGTGVIALGPGWDNGWHGDGDEWEDD